MQRFRGIIVALLFVCINNALADPESQSAKEAIPTESETLSIQAYSLVNEVEVLEQEIRMLRNQIADLRGKMDESEDGLKTVSIASTPARFYKKTLKTLQPQLDGASLQLQTKQETLRNKWIALGLIEEKLNLFQDEVGAPLLQIYSRHFNPDETSENPEPAQPAQD